MLTGMTHEQHEIRLNMMVARIVAETWWPDLLAQAVQQVKTEAAALRAENPKKYATLRDVEVAVAYMTAKVRDAMKDPKDAPVATLYTAVAAVIQNLQPDEEARAEAALLMAK